MINTASNHGHYVLQLAHRTASLPCTGMHVHLYPVALKGLVRRTEGNKVKVKVKAPGFKGLGPQNRG